MVYKLNVTDHADELLDNLVYHLIYRLKNKEAAKHLLDSVESIYDRLVENPSKILLIGKYIAHYMQENILESKIQIH